VSAYKRGGTGRWGSGLYSEACQEHDEYGEYTEEAGFSKEPFTAEYLRLLEELSLSGLSFNDPFNEPVGDLLLPLPILPGGPRG